MNAFRGCEYVQAIPERSVSAATDVYRERQPAAAGMALYFEGDWCYNRDVRMMEQKMRWSVYMKNNVILIGMPGCGKSTVGVVLAKAMGYRFMDSDLVIQESDGRLLSEIIDDEGLDGFNQIENRINAQIQADRTVIATGGSIIYGADAMAHMKELGVVVYIRLSYASIRERLGDLHNRGVSIRPGQTLEELYQERVPLYEKYADVIVDEEGKNISETALWIRDEVKDYFGEDQYVRKNQQ